MKSILLTSALFTIAAAAGHGEDHKPLRPVPKSDQGLTTGPAVGERLPAFSAPDQHGRLQTFESLTGPQGLVLLVVRSADW